MVMFEWLESHCPSTKYAMKVDSDMFLNVQKLVSMLSQAPQHLYITGLVIRNATVLRDSNSKWFMPDSVFPEPIYPTYVMGMGYVFSMDLAKEILNASAHVRAVYIEDVYVGLCMRYKQITATDPPSGSSFRTTKPFCPVILCRDNCYWTNVITTILHDSQQLLEVWKVYQTQVKSCAVQ